MRREEDPEFEEANLSELQDEAPEQAWMNDPRAEPVPGEGPGGADEYGVTAEEQAEGESLDQRLERERADVEENARQPRDVETDVAQGAGPASDRAGRLIEEDEGARTDTDKEAEARAATDIGRYSSEEEAVRVEEEQ